MLNRMKRKIRIPIGVWQNAEHFHLVWFSVKNNLCFLTLPDTQASKIESLILKESAIKDHCSIQKIEKNIEFIYISVLPPHLIWSKTMMIEEQLTDIVCEQYCEFVLTHSLPFSLQEINFDYTRTTIDNLANTTPNTQLSIFVCNKSTVKHYLNQLAPLRIDVLDHLAYCLLRAFQFLQPDYFSETNTLWIYNNNDNYVAIRMWKSQLQITQHTECQYLPEIKEKFIKRYGEEPVQCIITTNRHIKHIELPEGFIQISSDLPYIALGCALWGLEKIPSIK